MGRSSRLEWNIVVTVIDEHFDHTPQTTEAFTDTSSRSCVETDNWREKEKASRSRESNPGHIHVRYALCHWATTQSLSRSLFPAYMNLQTPKLLFTVPEEIYIKYFYSIIGKFYVITSIRKQPISNAKKTRTRTTRNFLLCKTCHTYITWKDCAKFIVVCASEGLGTSGNIEAGIG